MDLKHSKITFQYDPDTGYILIVKFEELYDLSEIIQFLPKNHPDIKIIHEIW